MSLVGRPSHPTNNLPSRRSYQFTRGEFRDGLPGGSPFQMESGGLPRGNNHRDADGSVPVGPSHNTKLTRWKGYSDRTLQYHATVIMDASEQLTSLGEDFVIRIVRMIGKATEMRVWIESRVNYQGAGCNRSGRCGGCSNDRVNHQSLFMTGATCQKADCKEQRGCSKGFHA